MLQILVCPTQIYGRVIKQLPNNRSLCWNLLNDLGQLANYTELCHDYHLSSGSAIQLRTIQNREALVYFAKSCPSVLPPSFQPVKLTDPLAQEVLQNKRSLRWAWLTGGILGVLALAYLTNKTRRVPQIVPQTVKPEVAARKAYQQTEEMLRQPLSPAEAELSYQLASEEVFKATPTETKWTGSITEDYMKALRYIQAKHKHSCTILADFRISIDLKNKTPRCERITNINPEAFQALISDCKQRYLIFPLSFFIKNEKGQRTWAHANVLIYNQDTKHVLRFEPYGITESEIINERVNAAVKHCLQTLFQVTKVETLTPQFCPQLRGGEGQLGDPAGFCQVWSVWFMDVFLSHPNLSLAEISRRAEQEIQNNYPDFKAFIRQYATFLIAYRQQQQQQQ
uniref:Uncharacterized protein n=1 Tax=viral metagenome TaxID=1070528 RepID=A0A6C0BQV9_9ZZZZ